MDFLELAASCAPTVHPTTIHALVRVESGLNPFAIGVVGGALERQPRNLAEAVATVRELERQGFNYSLGIAQVNKHNLPRYKLSVEQAFDACANLRTGGAILTDCFSDARIRFQSEQPALQAAISCYYSGNFRAGFRADARGQPSYVQKVLNAADAGRRAPSPVFRRSLTDTGPLPHP